MKNITNPVYASGSNAAACSTSFEELKNMFCEGARKALKGFVAPAELAVIDWQPKYITKVNDMLTANQVASPLFEEMLQQLIYKLAVDEADYATIVSSLRKMQGFWQKGEAYLPSDVCRAMSDGFKNLSVKKSLLRGVIHDVREISNQLYK